MLAKLSMGPVLFNWNQEKMEQFYQEIAKEPSIDNVYIGDTICSKRASFKLPFWQNIIRNLQDSGKKIIFSTLGVVSSESEIKSIKEFISNYPNIAIEANDISVFDFAKPYSVGPLLNIYNESALQFIESKAVMEATLPAEMSFDSLKAMAKSTNINLGVQVFGRMSLALSVRCYHARAYGLSKVNCNFVCQNDSDGLGVATLDNKNLFATNGIQTLSYNYCNLINELDDLRTIGIHNFRLSPHSNIDMIALSKIFRARLNGDISLKEANTKIKALSPNISFVNGFLFSKPGMNSVISDSNHI